LSTAAEDRRGSSPEARRRRALFGLLRWIEEREPTGVVRVSLGQAHVGSVVVAEGRLCLAVCERPAPEAERGFQDAGYEALDRLVSRAQGNGRRLCEAALDSPPDELDRIRGALKRQTAAGALAIADACAWGEPLFQSSQAANDYDPRLTFGPLQIFLAALASTDDAPTDTARRIFERFVEAGDAALLLTQSREPGGLPFPVAAHGLEEATLAEVIAIARSAREMCSPPMLTRASIAPRFVVMRGVGVTWVCVTGESRLTLVRTSGKVDAGPVISRAMRLLSDSS